MNEYTYQLQNYTNPITNEVTSTVLRSDGALIPANPANADYQAYLATLPSNSSTPQAGA